jgi:hypothetical protein
MYEQHTLKSTKLLKDKVNKPPAKVQVASTLCFKVHKFSTVTTLPE